MHTARSLFFLAIIIVLAPNTIGQREYFTTVIDEEIIIDGKMDEKAWEKVDFADDFTKRWPVYGEKSNFDSKFKFIYDDHAIYIAGELFDPNPDSVSYTLSTRDDTGNADWVGVSIDTYGNQVNSFGFIVTAAGVEIDMMLGTNSDDISWNAVWRSQAIKRDFGWSFEMKIPFSAIRFPNKDIQDWNINFYRVVRRIREESNWNPIDPQVFGEITQAGKLKGVKGIESPVRLSFTPYTTGYLENSYDTELQRQTWKRRITGGLDLKFGLNDAFTLDMTLIPDFGQTTSDKQILNLGPFEVRFNENRPFFIEGTELFTSAGIFYSRRIGGTPYYYSRAYQEANASIGETVKSNPGIAPLLNGTKVSGRTKKGMGIGVFNAIEGNTYAELVDSLGNVRKVETNPLTNYNILVLSQNLRNNSVVTFTNTNVMREGIAHDANVSALNSAIYSNNGKYRIRTDMSLSMLFRDDEPDVGHSMGAELAKVAGSWQYYFGYWEESDNYDPNDLGFLYNNNSRNYSSGLSWNDFKGTKRFFRRSVNINWYYEELYKPQLYSSTGGNVALGGLHKKQIYTRLSAGIRPFGTVNHFESRTFGKEVLFEPNADVSWFFTTDYSKRFALDGSIGYTQFFGVPQNNTSVYVSPRVRFSDRWNMVLESFVNWFKNDYGYVYTLDAAYAGDIILGTRDRMIVENSIRSELIFTKRMGVDLRLRHYWQQVQYSEFRQLLDEGEFVPTDYFPVDANDESLHNTSYNAFTLDVNYRWVFIPGSELRIVYKNNLFHSKTDLDPTYFSTFNTLFDQPQINSISMKFLIYIDVLYFHTLAERRKKRSNSVE